MHWVMQYIGWPTYCNVTGPRVVCYYSPGSPRNSPAGIHVPIHRARTCEDGNRAPGSTNRTRAPTRVCRAVRTISTRPTLEQSNQPASASPALCWETISSLRNSVIGDRWPTLYETDTPTDTPTDNPKPNKYACVINPVANTHAHLHLSRR
jgi:hypothetical protein